MTKAHVHYDSNNSGGSWWLTDDDWFALEKAGWEVEWVKDKEGFGGEERWLGALAMGAKYFGGSVEMAIAEFNHVTSAWAYDTGCSCCGEPHSFYAYDDEGNMVW